MAGTMKNQIPQTSITESLLTLISPVGMAMKTISRFSISSTALMDSEGFSQRMKSAVSLDIG